jgi:hypothetical protein
MPPRVGDQPAVTHVEALDAAARSGVEDEDDVPCTVMLAGKVPPELIVCTLVRSSS